MLRLLRPCFLLGRQRDLRRVFNIIVMMLPRLLTLYMVLFWYILFFGLIGIHVFPDSYSPANADRLEVSIACGHASEKALVSMCV